ncbi:unnamed protein product, partial [Rotaria sp. Silwood1]
MATSTSNKPRCATCAKVT